MSQRKAYPNPLAGISRSCGCNYRDEYGPCEHDFALAKQEEARANIDTICKAVSPYGRRCSRPEGHYHYGNNKQMHRSYDFWNNLMIEEWAELLQQELTDEQKAKKKKLTEAFEAIFNNAGIKYEKVQEIPNGYWWDQQMVPDQPWFIFWTELGPIEIGWRKRVISIRWPLDLKVDGGELQNSDEAWITSGENFMHAYAYDSATRYMKLLKWLIKERK